MELRTIARFPFLEHASEFIRSEGPTLEELLLHPAYEEVRRDGMSRVRRALEEGRIPDGETNTEADSLRELLSYPIARMIVSGVGDAYLIRRYSLAEAEKARRNMTSEDNDFISHVAKDLGMDFRMDGLVLLHFADYLRYSVQMKSKDWKLVNQRLAEGYVRLGRDRFVRVLQEAIQRRMESELPLAVNDQILGALEDKIGEIGKLTEEKKEQYKVEDMGRIRITRVPPCMRDLIRAIQVGKHIPHTGRFALTAFLHNIGLSSADIFRLYSLSPDFQEGKTKYQIGHISGEISGTEYTPPECSTMQSYGLCPGPDDLCKRIKHPLNYYRIKGKKRG
ncbi:MAG: DNA primase large subunit PriL [Candidatus Thermoplasmatota archaeon]|nr:DNA primase large subunit PriL [Candidatus Thermoplasmatota archaeon]